MRSDSQVARDLQAAFDSGLEADNMNSWDSTSTARPRSDSDLARALQESLNSNMGDLPLPVLHNNDEMPIIIDSDNNETQQETQIEQK